MGQDGEGGRVSGGIVAFVHARYDELEAAANAADDGPWTTKKNPGSGDDWSILGKPTTTARYDPSAQQHVAVPTRRKIAGPGYEGGGVWGDANAQHIALNDSAHVLACIAAARARVDLALQLIAERAHPFWASTGRQLLKLEVAPFASHPDFDPAWTVTDHG